jgi:hypothetical protein
VRISALTLLAACSEGPRPTDCCVDAATRDVAIPDAPLTDSEPMSDLPLTDVPPDAPPDTPPDTPPDVFVSTEDMLIQYICRTVARRSECEMDFASCSAFFNSMLLRLPTACMPQFRTWLACAVSAVPICAVGRASISFLNCLREEDQLAACLPARDAGP